MVKHQIKRCWRFCSNERVETADAMRPIVAQLLKKRKNKLLVAVDWVDIKGFQTLVASVVLKGRSVPIAWASTTGHVYDGHTSRNAFEESLLLVLRDTNLGMTQDSRCSRSSGWQTFEAMRKLTSHFSVATTLGLAACFATGQTSRPVVQTRSGEVDRVFVTFSNGGVDLTAEQRTKADAIEASTLRLLAADPKKWDDETFVRQIARQFREMLTAEQKEKFDQRISQCSVMRDGIRTFANSEQIALGLVLDVSTRPDHRLPPTLGAMADRFMKTPARFLLPDSDKTVPADWAKMTDRAKAGWIDQNTDYVYIAAGQQSSIDGLVTAYIEPAKATRGNCFVMADGTVRVEPGKIAGRVIAELKAGRNPPPSLPKI